MTDSDRHDTVLLRAIKRGTSRRDNDPAQDATRGQTERQTKPATAPARKRGGRPRKARGAATSADKAAARWTVRGVPLNVRAIATKAAENRGMTVGDWISEAVVAFSKADANRVSADVPAVATAELIGVIHDVQARLTILETRDTRGLLGKLFGKGSDRERQAQRQAQDLGKLFGKGTVAAVLLAVFLISGTAWALQPGEYKIRGSGSQSCGSWTAAKEKGNWDRVVFLSWVGGYLTAYSRWVEKDYRGSVTTSDSEGAWAWVDNYCRDNPLDNVALAASELILALKAK